MEENKDAVVLFWTQGYRLADANGSTELSRPTGGQRSLDLNLGMAGLQKKSKSDE